MRGGETSCALFLRPDRAPADLEHVRNPLGKSHHAFEVGWDDLKAAEALFTARGVPYHAPIDWGDHDCLYFLDPDGNLLELVGYRPKGESHVTHAAEPTGWVGRPMKRREDRTLVTGRGRFVDDLKVAGVLHLILARSPHAHARIRSLDTAAARTTPGVVAVVVAGDLGSVGPVPLMRLAPGTLVPDYPLLAADVVRAQGVPVAAVVAESTYAAVDGVDRLAIEYEPLEGVSDADGALTAGAAQVVPVSRDNRALTVAWRHGDAERAFRDAAHRVTADRPAAAAVRCADGAARCPRSLGCRHRRAHDVDVDAVAVPDPLLAGAHARPRRGACSRDRSRRRRRVRGEGWPLSRGDSRRVARAPTRPAGQVDVDPLGRSAHDQSRPRRQIDRRAGARRRRTDHRAAGANPPASRVEPRRHGGRHAAEPRPLPAGLLSGGARRHRVDRRVHHDAAGRCLSRRGASGGGVPDRAARRRGRAHA